MTIFSASYDRCKCWWCEYRRAFYKILPWEGNCLVRNLTMKDITPSQAANRYSAKYKIIHCYSTQKYNTKSSSQSPVHSSSRLFPHNPFQYYLLPKSPKWFLPLQFQTKWSYIYLFPHMLYVLNLRAWPKLSSHSFNRVAFFSQCCFWDAWFEQLTASWAQLDEQFSRWPMMHFLEKLKIFVLEYILLWIT